VPVPTTFDVRWSPLGEAQGKTAIMFSAHVDADVPPGSSLAALATVRGACRASGIRIGNALRGRTDSARGSTWEDIRHYRLAVTTADTAAVRDFARRTIPVLRTHLQWFRAAFRDL
jgi:hypothetical protein